MLSVSSQVDNPSMRWQMALYKEMAGKAEDADAPEKVVKRVQEVSAVLYHIEVVSLNPSPTQIDHILMATHSDYHYTSVSQSNSPVCCLHLH